MSAPENAPAASASAAAPILGRRRTRVILALGCAQILAWGSSYYLPAVLARPTASATGWSLALVVGGLSLGLLVSGLISPHIGALIEARGGRPVLAASAVLLALGLVLLGLAPNRAVYVAGWLAMGLAMGAGLYDPAFATLGRLYGAEARVAITSLTLVAGFASTVCWPLSAFLLAHLGWRGTCFAYAALNLGVTLPLYLFALPREPRRARPPRRARAVRGAGDRRHMVLFGVVAFGLTLASVIAAVMSVHLLSLLRARGLSADFAVALGAAVGPCQVGARLVDLVIGRRYHPIWGMLLSTLLVALGAMLMLGGRDALVAGIVAYGLGIGLRSIVRGTLPLALFGAEGYAVLIGRLAFPALVAQAAAPSLGAVWLEHFGAGALLHALLWAALLNIAATLVLLAVLPRGQRRRG